MAAARAEAEARSPGRAAIPDALGRLRLEVHVYAPHPADRFVYLNGRKYVEGQAVEGDAVVESITSDGVVLNHAGERFLLRP